MRGVIVGVMIELGHELGRRGKMSMMIYMRTRAISLDYDLVRVF